MIMNYSTAAFTWQHLSDAPTTIDRERIDPELLPALSEIPKELASLNRDTVESVRTIWAAKKAKASPYAAAARAVDLTGLPPAYISVGTEDLFRDENALYAHRLIAAGVTCEFSMYPGVFHGADGFVPTAQVSQRMVGGYRSALAQALTN